MSTLRNSKSTSSKAVKGSRTPKVALMTALTTKVAVLDLEESTRVVSQAKVGGATARAGVSYEFPVDMTMDDDVCSQAEAKVDDSQAEAKVDCSQAEAKVDDSQDGAKEKRKPFKVFMSCCNMCEQTPRYESTEDWMTYDVPDGTTYADVIQRYMAEPFHIGRYFKKLTEITKFTKVFKAELYELNQAGEVSDAHHAEIAITGLDTCINMDGSNYGQILHLTTSLPSIFKVSIRAEFKARDNRDDIEFHDFYVPSDATFGYVVGKFMAANRAQIDRTTLIHPFIYRDEFGQLHTASEREPIGEMDISLVLGFQDAFYAKWQKEIDTP